MEVIRETLWKRCLSTPIKPPAKSSNICLSETAYQHKGTRRKCKKTNQAAIIQWQRQCIMDKPHCKPWPKSKTNDISKQSPSPLHHTFLLGRARFTAQPLAALSATFWIRSPEWKFLHTLRIQNRVDAKSGYFLIRRRKKIEPRAQLFEGRLALNQGFFNFLELKSIFSDNFLCYF